MVNDVGDIDALGAQLVALVGQRRFRAGFESEVIKGSRNPKAAIYARVVFRRQAGNSARFHEGDELVAARVEEHVPDTPALLDLKRVSDYRFEPQHALVKLAGLVEVKCRKANVGKSFVTHGYSSLYNPVTRDRFDRLLLQKHRPLKVALQGSEKQGLLSVRDGAGSSAQCCA